MSWFTKHVYDYCEQGHSPAFWSQPVNALTNIGYILAALLIWRMLRRERRAPFSIRFVVPLMIIIGIGSFLFHTVSDQAAELLDRIPIEVFVLSYLVTFLRWFYGLTWKRCLLGLGAFLVFTVAFAALVGTAIPNQSGQYVPVLLLLLGLTYALGASADRDRSVHWRSFALASVVFAAALVARTVDESVCGDFPLGTHFIWHLLTACLLYIVSRSLVLRWRAVSTVDAPTADEADDVGVPS
jgi:peptidoglycan/LPS O-acetylase OafA/YrhL